MKASGSLAKNGGVVFPRKFHRTRCPVLVEESVAQKVLEQMQEAGYREYNKGEMPSTVNAADWNHIVRQGAFKGGGNSSRHHDSASDNCSD